VENQSLGPGGVDRRRCRAPKGGLLHSLRSTPGQPRRRFYVESTEGHVSTGEGRTAESGVMLRKGGVPRGRDRARKSAELGREGRLKTPRPDAWRLPPLSDGGNNDGILQFLEPVSNARPISRGAQPQPRPAPADRRGFGATPAPSSWRKPSRCRCGAKWAPNPHIVPEPRHSPIFLFHLETSGGFA
jgi:hypothetical protein